MVVVVVVVVVIFDECVVFGTVDGTWFVSWFRIMTSKTEEFPQNVYFWNRSIFRKFLESQRGL